MGYSKGFKEMWMKERQKMRGELVPLSFLFHIFVMKSPKTHLKEKNVMTEDIDFNTRHWRGICQGLYHAIGI